MALVTLAQAKAHLRIDGDDADTDLAFKLEAATDIVLNYLKARANRTATIGSASVANPTILTAVDEDGEAIAHHFVTGEPVVITDDVDAVPTINGTYTLTVVSTSTFSIPVNVTTASTGASASVMWTGATAPRRIQMAVLITLAHLYRNRGEGSGGGAISGGQPDEELWKGLDLYLKRDRDPAMA